MLSALIAPCLAAGSPADVAPHQAPGPWRKKETCSCCSATQLARRDIISRWRQLLRDWIQTENPLPEYLIQGKSNT